ncbi:MAG: hypothetical protein Q8P12_07735, partial [bacterium]|nr:hypothetical protein [bacterium]
DEAKPEETGKDQPEEDEGKSGEETGGEDQSEEEGESQTEGEEVPTTEGEGHDEGRDAEAGSGTGEAEEGAESEDEEEQKLGHFGGDVEESGEDKEEPSQGGESPRLQSGDSDGAPGNLDEFDVRDIEGLPEEILEQVADAVAHELEDLSKSVALALGDSSIKAQTRRADYDGPAAQKAREQVEPEIMALRRLFERQRMEVSRSLTGLTSGKLNGRKLARAGAGNFHVFKRREVIGKPDMAVGLLLDVSGSMNRNMGVVWMTASVFGEALSHVDGVNFLCLTYTGSLFDVNTTLICSREVGKVCFGNVDQGGGTPSGPAIATMKVHLDRMPGKRKVIIHFTDGSPDDTDSVVNAVQACHKDGYEVWSIGLKGEEKELADQYGEGNYKTISTIRELPEKVGELLKKLVMDR